MDRTRSTLRFPLWPCLAAALVTLTTVGFLAVGARRSLATIREFELRELAIERVCGEIVYLDEVLTMSARMAAATGDAAWEERYRAHVPELDRAIAQATALAPDAEEAIGSLQTREANRRLLAIEAAAFDLVREGRTREASLLLDGREYSENKRIYSAGTQRSLESMRTRVSLLLAASRRRAQFHQVLLLVSVPLLLLLWGLSGRALVNHVRLRQELEASLRDQADELEESSRRVQEASRAKSEFLAKMSHEIRTPMNGVLGAAEILAATELSTDQDELVAAIRSSGRSLLAVIGDILDYAKIESGKLRVESARVDPLEVAREVLQVVGSTASSRGIDLICEGEEPPQHVLADEVRLRQILLNLVGNALKFTEAGAVRLRVRSEGDRGVVEVHDTGIGIDPEHLERIFEDFEQLGRSTNQEGGTGLGLAISQELARLMDGELTATSEVGAGSVFTLTLPLALRGGEHAGTLEEVPAALPRQGLRVLVAEDQRVNQLIARRMLEGLACEVTVVDDGEACVRAATGADYDLILMDCHMPTLDGFEATRAIRAQEDGEQRVPIVAVTASTFPGDIEACRRAGMDDHLGKPHSVAELAAVVSRWTGACVGKTPAKPAGSGAQPGPHPA